MTHRTAFCAAIIMSAMSFVQIGSATADGLDVIAVRQAGYALQGGDFAFIRSVVEAKADVKPLEVPAKAIGKWASVVPTLFPKGSETGGDTKALPEIWSDPEGFRKIAIKLQEVSDKLAIDAKAGNADEVASDSKLMGQQCGACHKAYRAK